MDCLNWKVSYKDDILLKYLPKFISIRLLYTATDKWDLLKLAHLDLTMIICNALQTRLSSLKQGSYSNKLPVSLPAAQDSIQTSDITHLIHHKTCERQWSITHINTGGAAAGAQDSNLQPRNEWSRISNTRTESHVVQHDKTGNPNVTTRNVSNEAGADVKVQWKCYCRVIKSAVLCWKEIWALTWLGTSEVRR